DLLRQPMRGEEDAALQAGRPARQDGADLPGERGDEAGLLGIAAERAHRDGKPRFERRTPPVGQRGLRRRGRGLRIERQQDDLVGAPGLHRRRGLGRERPPIAHGDEDAGVVAQRRLERARLRLGIGEKRRGAAQSLIDRPGDRCAAAGDELRQQKTQRLRQTDDGAIVVEVEEKGLDNLQQLRTAEIEEDDGGAAHRGASGWRSSATSSATCSTGVSGTMQWPRLKMKGPAAKAWRIAATLSAMGGPPAASSSGSRLPCTGPIDCSVLRAIYGGTVLSRPRAVTPLPLK